MAPDIGLSGSARPLRVLIADDNKDAADMVAMNLKSPKLEVSVVNSGKAALQSAHTSVPDVVILDIGMENPNGYDVARSLRRDFAASRMLILAVTGWAGEGNRQRALDAGFDHHFVKPVATAELLATIGKWSEEAA
jgi:two-component system OmpR family response regulator